VARLNVLMTAASRRVALVQGLRRAVSRPGYSGEVVVCDVNPHSPAVQMAHRAYEVPLSDDPAYLDTIFQICQAHDIGLVVPTIDDELPLFAEHRARFESAGIKVSVSPLETTLACNDKLATCQRLRAAGVAAAATWLPRRLPKSATTPLFIKPRGGRGGVQAYRANTAEELAFFSNYVADAVVQEFLDGPEFTLDLFCDFRGRPLSVVPRQRVVIRAGVIDRGRTVDDPALIDLALQCARVFDFFGPVNIQCRIAGGRPVVFEINARFSGGIPLTIAAGADFPAMLVDLALGRKVAPAIGRFRAGLWMSSYETSLFFDERQAALERLTPVGVREAIR
jgi:carbamoyl-phosphate synthase large subunit